MVFLFSELHRTYCVASYNKRGSSTPANPLSLELICFTAACVIYEADFLNFSVSKDAPPLIILRKPKFFFCSYLVFVFSKCTHTTFPSVNVPSSYI